MTLHFRMSGKPLLRSIIYAEKDVLQEERPTKTDVVVQLTH